MGVQKSKSLHRNSLTVRDNSFTPKPLYARHPTHSHEAVPSMPWLGSLHSDMQE